MEGGGGVCEEEKKWSVCVVCVTKLLFFSRLWLFVFVVVCEHARICMFYLCTYMHVCICVWLYQHLTV